MCLITTTKKKKKGGGKDLIIIIIINYFVLNDPSATPIRVRALQGIMVRFLRASLSFLTVS